jgi:nucleoside-diphosphate-sugar epimerase
LSPTDLSGATCLVTGVAGFIGSHIAEALLLQRCRVVGVDVFTDYYPRDRKEANLAGLRTNSDFMLVEADLAVAELVPLLTGVDYVFHQAGEPGVQSSWGENFAAYVRQNVLVTQKLLEAARAVPLRRFVYASSSSIYGDVPDLPISETTLPRPVSPYGVTKLAAEHLATLYARNFDLPSVSLRYFTVYGPRQRPDMAFHRFIRRSLAGQPLEVNGDGEQTRDFTFVSDIVQANLAAATAGRDTVAGRAYNIGGGSPVSINRVIDTLSELVGTRASVVHRPSQSGDPRHTFADCSAAARDLGYAPCVGLSDGLRAQVDWLVALSDVS